MTIPAFKNLASFRLTREEQTTASDHRKVSAPRGQVRIDDRMLAAARQRAEGVSTTEIAARGARRSRTGATEWRTRKRMLGICGVVDDDSSEAPPLVVRAGADGSAPMTRSEWAACIRELSAAADEAEASGDEDAKLGAAMALDAFLSVVGPAPMIPADVRAVTTRPKLPKMRRK